MGGCLSTNSLAFFDRLGDLGIVGAFGVKHLLSLGDAQILGDRGVPPLGRGT